jgi:hypothetical protein
MARELGGSQISALLESVPGIVNVLRSPVADALVNMIRAGAGIEEFDVGYAEELVQYAVRRGLIGASEGDEVLADVRAATKGRGRKKKGATKKRSGHAAARPKRVVKKASAKPKGKPAAHHGAVKKKGHAPAPAHKTSRSARTKRR